MVELAQVGLARHSVDTSCTLAPRAAIVSVACYMLSCQQSLESNKSATESLNVHLNVLEALLC